MMKDRKKMAAELHHRKQEGNGTSMIFGRKVPVIKEVYDPLTGLRNGTITPNAPVVILAQGLSVLTAIPLISAVFAENVIVP